MNRSSLALGLRGSTLGFLVTLFLLTACSGPWTLPVESEEGGILLAAWDDGTDLIAVGGQLDNTDALMLRREAGTWCKEEGVADRALWWIHGSRPGRWFGVGASGLILHHEDGSTVDESVNTTGTLFGVWDEGDRVWAVGGNVQGGGGEIWLRENGVWLLFAEDLPGVVFKVWEDWFVGDGVAWTLDESDELQPRFPPANEKLLTVRGRASDDVWAVGGVVSSVLLHYNGSTWESVPVDPLCTSQPLNGIWTAPGEDVWIAGMSGAMARFDGEEWHCGDLVADNALRDLSHAHFHAVWPGENGEMLWFGGNFFARGGNVFTLGRHSETPDSLNVRECSD